METLAEKSLKVSSYWLRTPHPPGLHQRALESLIRDVAEGRLRIFIGLFEQLSRAAVLVSERLIKRARLSRLGEAAALPERPGRAVDLGGGTGVTSVFLAQRVPNMIKDEERKS